ncbi:MAG: DeoR/GlpR family DNA-binding transcription regulator [Erysipelotrichaceae bacterium]
MQASERRMKIFEILQLHNNVEINELATEFQVTTMTIRRDLMLFESKGLVTTTYGGAYLNKGATIEPSFMLKTTQNKEDKSRIALKAAAYIKDGDFIIIDCGTTTYELVKYLTNKKLTVITNSLPVINYLKDYENITLIMAPGQYDDTSAGAIGSLTIHFYEQLKADKVFVSTQGLDVEYGLSVPGMIDRDVKKAILNAAKEKYLLVDHTKFNQTYLAAFASVDEFDFIISDQEAPSAIHDKIKNKAISYIIA